MSTNLEILEELTTSLLNESEDYNLYKEALDLLPIGVAIISSRIVTWTNVKTLSLFGYSSLSEIVGQNCTQFYISRDEYERAGRDCYPDGGQTMARMRMKDGSEKIMNIRVQIHNAKIGRALVIFCSLNSLKNICRKFGKCLEGECE